MDPHILEGDHSTEQVNIPQANLYICPMARNSIEARFGQLPLINALLAGAVYTTTMAPTISHTDSGELAAVAFTGGVAHPTGYPLFTILGWIWTRIPVVKPALQLNFLCLILVALGVFFFSKALQTFFDHWRTKVKSEADGGQQLLARTHLFANLTGSLLLAFSHTFWFQSTSVEVYSLHICLVCLTFWLLLRAWYAPKEEQKPWLWLAGAMALGFANHLTYFTILPAIGCLYFYKHRFEAASFKRLGLMLAVFIPLLALQYLWLPLAAGADPNMNWGNPESWPEFWHHVSGRQFSVWLFTGQEAFKAQLGKFLENLPWEFMIGGLLLVLPGIYYAWKVRRQEAIALILLILVNTLYCANYDIKDLEPYFLPTIISLSFFAAIGVRFLWIKAKVPANTRNALVGVSAVVILLPLVLNYPKVSQRGVWYYEDYARAALESLPENAIVISKTWDSFVSPAYYLQEVEGVRTDVDIVEYQMLHDRHWYPEHIMVNMPETAQRIQPYLNNWNAIVGEFDLDGKLDPAKLGKGLQDVYYPILAEFRHRPTYLGFQIFPGAMNGDGFLMPEEITVIPEGFFLRIIPRENLGQYYPMPNIDREIRLPLNPQVPEEELVVESWASILAQRAVYELVLGKPEAAREIKAKLQRIAPNRPLPTTLENI